MPYGSIIDESNSPITNILGCVSGTDISKRCDLKWALKTAMLKEVDWSLLTEGLTLPIKEQVAFGQIMGRFLEKGESKPIRLILGGKTYNATIRNVKFQEKWNHKSDILQIRYVKNGDLARALQVVFSKSYNYLNGVCQSREKGDRRIIRLPDDAKDFLAIYTTEFDDTYVLDPILSEDVIAVATYARDFSEQHIENEMNFEIDDPSAGIQVSEGVRKIRKLNKKIGDNLKQLYRYRCQICGQSIGEEYGAHVCEAHHIDYFTKSLNNSATNQMIVCPKHCTYRHTYRMPRRKRTPQDSVRKKS